METKFPLAWSYLQDNRKKLEQREKGKFKNESWYAFGYAKSMTLFRRPKIVVPDYNNVASFAIDENGFFYKTGYGVLPKVSPGSTLYLLGLLVLDLLALSV